MRVPCEGKESKKDSRRSIDLVWFLGSLTSSRLLRGPRRAERRNVAVGAPAGDHRVRVLHRPRRRIRVPENDLRRTHRWITHLVSIISIWYKAGGGRSAGGRSEAKPQKAGVDLRNRSPSSGPSRDRWWRRPLESRRKLRSAGAAPRTASPTPTRPRTPWSASCRRTATGGDTAPRPRRRPEVRGPGTHPGQRTRTKPPSAARKHRTVFAVVCVSSPLHSTLVRRRAQGFPSSTLVRSAQRALGLGSFRSKFAGGTSSRLDPDSWVLTLS